MANKISMYRLFDEGMAEQLQVTNEMSFFYQEGDGQVHLLEPTLDYEHKTLLSNEDDSWDYERYGFGMSINLMFGSSNTLFGPDKLLNTDAELGIALQWMSKQSSQRGVIPIATITKDTPDNLTIPIRHYFPKDLLFGEVQVSVVFYLKKSSASSHSGQAQLSGTLLGELADWLIILDGSGSTFPIVVINEPDKPLWYVDFNYTEALIEPFDKEYITIYLNKAHTAFSAIHDPKTPVEQSLYVSFLAGALQLILQNLMQCADWQDIHDGTNCEEGSIGQVMHYFITTFDWNLDAPEKLAMSLHKDLEARVKVGGI